MRNAKQIWAAGATTNADIRASRTAWMIIGAAFQDAHPLCDECSHCVRDIDAPQYGDGPRGEVECMLGQCASDEPNQCAAYIEHLEILADEAEQ